MNRTPEPLSDLHRHLDGSLRPSTVVELAAQRGVAVPERLVFEEGMGLEAALARFAFTLSLLGTEDAVRRVAFEMCEDAAADGVSTLEIRFAPQLHGPDPARFVDAALMGISDASCRFASPPGLLLCGLYGEPPHVLETLVDIAVPRPGVVGIDLAGGPAPSHDFAMGDYAAPFRRAAVAGLGRTVHAGEGRPPEEIRVAIEMLGAQRIGHGTTVLDDPEVAALVLRNGVTIEACPTSNVHTGVLGDVAEHPIGTWLKMGIKACICTDNTLLSAISASEELERVKEAPGMDMSRLRQAVEYGHAARFVRL